MELLMFEIRQQGNKYYVAKFKERKDAEKAAQLWKQWYPEFNWEVLPEHPANITKRKRRSA